METFADVLHAIIDTVFMGDAADKAHAIITQASGPRTPQEEPEAAEETPAEPGDEPVVPGADEPEEAPPTPGG